MCLIKNVEHKFINKSLSTIAQKLGGEYIHKWPVPDKIVLREEEYLVIIDTCPTAIGTMYIDCTRIMVYFVSTDQFNFLIFNKDIFSKVFSVFYGPYIRTGYQQIDNSYLVRSNSYFKIRTLLSNPDIRSLILKQPSIHLEIKSYNKLIKPDLSKHICILYYESIGVTKNIDRIKEIILLYKEILTQLFIMGSISEELPKITLDWIIDNNCI
jgi:hypothetical protein